MMRDRGSIRVAGCRKSPRRRAATLIELLVVIGMVGFLTSLLIPSLKRSTDMAAATICRHHLREIGHLMFMYRDDNNGWFPVVTPPQEQAQPTVTAQAAPTLPQRQPWFEKLYPTYMQDLGVLRCPRDPFGHRIGAAATGAIVTDVPEFASYGLNNFMMTFNGGALANVDRHALRRPLDTILSADLGPDVGGSASTSRSGAPDRNSGLMRWGDGFDPFATTQSHSWLTNRHGSGIHVLTLAGSVRDVRTTELLRMPISRYYSGCAAGGCTLCNELKYFHYSFAKDQLFWWTGPVPPP